MVTSLEALDLPIRRAKLRVPRLGGSLVPRPRLMARLDQCLQTPLTLVAAPAGFGKTTLLAEWAAGHALPLAWLTVDANADDRDLRRFVPHVVAAIETVAPGCAAPVLELLKQPQLVKPSEIGAVLAEELLDLTDDVILVIDDFQLAASVNVERFLGTLLQIEVPSLHLVISTRSDPALPLARMRLHGQLIELRAADLRFNEEEALALLGAMGHGDADTTLVAALQQQIGGWIAGLRLAILALPTGGNLARTMGAASSEQHLMDFLVEEVLAAQPAATQDFLLRTAIVDRVCASLAESLLDTAPPEGSWALLERLTHESLFLERESDQERPWYRYHPLFRSLLRHQLEARSSTAERATLHIRASDWYAENGFLDLAIRHRVAAGDAVGAVSLVEHNAHTALAREDWNTLDRWLRLLPESIVRSRPGLLLAKGWVSHFSGRSIPLSALSTELNALLKTVDAGAAEIAAWEAERDILSMTALLWFERDPEAVLAVARRAATHIPAHHRLAVGQAGFWTGMVLHSTGRTDEAIRWLTAEVERGEERVDAGSVRALGGLMFVHRQAGNVRACEEVSQHALTLLQRYDLPVATAWTRWMLGWIAYERNELTTAAEHFSAITADARRVHFHTACEAMFGLALIYQAQQMPVEAAGTLRRLLELIFDANALEYLPLVRGFEARLALGRGERERAIAWMETEPGVTFASNGLDCSEHPYLTRIRVLLAEGSPANVARAWQDLVAFRDHTEALHHKTHAIEILTLEALLLAARGETEAGLTALARAVELAAAAGFVRTFVDLGPAVTPLLRRLMAKGATTLFLYRLLEAIEAEHTPEAPELRLARTFGLDEQVLTLLTVREAEVLECLARRLSYQEIGAELFISPETVKTHAANIYSKLGVGNRGQALAKVQELGWSPRA
jgi:LuxR family maltose regulon positive regulatory protein